MRSTLSTAFRSYRPAASADGTASPSWPARIGPMHTLLVLGASDVAAGVVAVAVAGGTALGAGVFALAAVAIDALDPRRRHRLSLSGLDDAPALAVRGYLIATAAALAGIGVHGGRLPGGPAGLGVLAAAGVYAAAALVGRGIGYQVIRRLHAAGRLAQPALVVGATPLGADLARRMRDHPENGLVPVGFVDDATHADADRLPAPILGDIGDLPKVVAAERIRHVFVAFCHVRDANLVESIRACDRLDCEVHVVPRLFELGVAGRGGTDRVWDVPLLRLRRAPFRSGTWPGKRLLDVVVAAVALVLAAPVMLVIAVLLRREVRDSALFRQERVGLDGRPFVLVKFRTLKPAPDGYPAAWSVVDAGRIGPVGRFLRRSSLDELPQLWNVLCGHMSLVGPRPEQPHYVQQFARRHRRYSARHRVPAGITGLAQVHDLRGDTSIADRIRLDNHYIEHWSFWQDVKILVRTLWSVFRMRGG